MILRIFATSLAALLVGAFVEEARADQAFICKDGSLVQVERGQLKRMKRKNACVAKHFGRGTQNRRDARARPIAVSAATGKGVRVVPLPSRRPSPSVLRTAQLDAMLKTGRPSSNYRMVRIINAPRGAKRWYRNPR